MCGSRGVSWTLLGSWPRGQFSTDDMRRRGPVIDTEVEPDPLYQTGHRRQGQVAVAQRQIGVSMHPFAQYGMTECEQFVREG